jgi:flagellar biogenesis protein FliO
MSLGWAMTQIIFILVALGYGAYYMMKKVQKTQFNRVGQKGIIKIVDGMTLNHHTSSFLVDVDGQQVFIVVGQSGIETTVLKERRFEELMKKGLEENE